MDKVLDFPAPERAYIDGAWVEALSGARFATKDPATGEILAEVPDMAAEDTRLAIEAAARAFEEWRACPVSKRSGILRRMAESMYTHKESLAHLLTREQGKPLFESRGEVAYAASFLQWFSEEAPRLDGDVLPSLDSTNRMFVLPQPIGVCALITPWNFPYAMITRKLGAALAAGCTAIVKPAEQTPLCAFALAHLAEQAGLPQGVLNVVSALNPEPIGTSLMESEVVRKVSFTGSTEVGKLLIRQSAQNVKKLSLELGGHAPFIVFEDADVEAAVEGAMMSKFRNSGQTCVCANRFYIHESLYDEFAEKFSARIASLKVGNGLSNKTELGPLIDLAAVAKSKRHVEDARRKGARVLCGGEEDEAGVHFFQPTLLGDVRSDMCIVQEETFGPVAPLLRFREEREVIALANATPYGLACYFYSQGLGRVFRVAEALEYGIVSINTGRFSNERAPFGGVKQSGYGREGSKYGIEEYVERKYVMLAGLG